MVLHQGTWTAALRGNSHPSDPWHIAGREKLQLSHHWWKVRVSRDLSERVREWSEWTLKHDQSIGEESERNFLHTLQGRGDTDSWREEV